MTAADGSGTWRPYQVGEVRASGVVGVRLGAVAEAEREPQLSPLLAVAFALTKGGKPELVVQKLTEVGVDRILPVVSDRSIARPDATKAAVLEDRWRKIAREAARQCRRATLPVVEGLAPLARLAGHLGLVVAERGGRPVEALALPPGGEILVVVGPEGGLGEGEVDALTPWARLDLGPHVLRAETAALAAAAVITTRRG